MANKVKEEMMETRTCMFVVPKKLLVQKFFRLTQRWIYRHWQYCTIILTAILVLHCVNYNGKSEISEATTERKDVSSSIVSMIPLMKIEQRLIQALDEHANRLQHKVNEIRKGILTMRKVKEIYDVDEEKFLSNPLNSFPMLRRLKTEWKAWEKYLKAPIEKDFIEIIHNTLLNLTIFDLVESVDGIQRLRETYDISPNNWAEGKLYVNKYNIHFTALDCYAVGYLLYKQDRHESADEWFQAALDAYKYQNMYKYLGFNRQTIFEVFIENLLFQNRTEMALQIVRSAISEDPFNPKLLQKKLFIKNLIKNNDEHAFALMLGNVKKIDIDTLKISTNRGCRNEYAQNVSSELFCYYNWSANDFVRLAPFKVEELHLEPIILLYHDVVNDDEIDSLKNVSKHKLKRSKMLNKDGACVPYSNRTSKNFLLKDNFNEVSLRLNQRIEDMTGLYAMGTNFLISNFGLGGHSGPHMDCSNVCNGCKEKENFDDRLATVLFTLSEVPVGGATLFPKLQIGVVPRKGTALFWYLLENDMTTCDPRMLQLACPVVVGSKWVLKKWIQYKDQLFRKPCLANFTDKGYKKISFLK